MSQPSGDELLLLHNPRCSKSRATRELLEARGVRFRERRYLEDPLSRAELAELREALGKPVREWLRSGEAAFAEAGLGDGSDEAAMLAAMASHPILIERPILLRRPGNARPGKARAIVGRPPENVLELLD